MIMGIYYSAYFAYGFEIPATDPDALDTALTGCPVGYMHAGNYDRDRTFLVTSCMEVSIGDFRKVTPEAVTPEGLEQWNRELTEAAARLGVHTGFEPGWLVIPDLS